MTACDTLTGLLYGVLRNPADDLCRLIYADALEETGDPVNVERAQFIRVQIELAKVVAPWCEKTESPVTDKGYAKFTSRCRCEWCRMKRREYMVSRRHIVWDWMGGVGGYGTIAGSDGWSRGFLPAVRCRLDTWIGGHSNFCRHLPTEFTCPVCNGSGRSVALGPRIVSEHPVTTVTITDREPHRTGDGPPTWFRVRNNAERHTDRSIPECLFDAMEGCYPAIDGRSVAEFSSPEAARHALSKAAIRWARAEAQRTNLLPAGLWDAGGG